MFRPHSFVWFALVSLVFSPLLRGQDLGGDLALRKLLIDGEGWQVVADGLGFADGPLGDAEGNFYFSDLKAPGIYRIGLDGSKTKVSDEAGSGLKFGADGRLYACQGAKKRVVAIDLGGKEPLEVIAENVEPNDLAISRSSQLYFTETGKRQVTRVDLKTRMVSVADSGITAPNGIALSPDEGTLVVSDYRGRFVWTFSVQADGTLAGKAPNMTLRCPIDAKGKFEFNQPPPSKEASGGDGTASDDQGRFYVASALGVQVFDPTGRECGLLLKPERDQPLTSCALSGPGRAYLYVTHGTRVLRRKVQANSIAPEK